MEVDAFEILVEHVKVLVRLIELDAEHCRRSDIVPEQVHRTTREDRKERLDQRGIPYSLEKRGVTMGEFRVDRIPGDVEVERPALHLCHRQVVCVDHRRTSCPACDASGASSLTGRAACDQRSSPTAMHALWIGSPSAAMMWKRRPKNVPCRLTLAMASAV